VKVEADRGEDLGVVVSKSLVEDFVEFVPTAGYRGRGYSAGLGEKKYIIRFATAEERMLLRIKVEDEERTLQVSCIHCHSPCLYSCLCKSLLQCVAMNDIVYCISDPGPKTLNSS
jgi:hypothetical protein